MNSVPSPDNPPPNVDVGVGIVIRRQPDQNAKTSPETGRDHEILITRRKDHTVYGGWWELPGGKIEPGESPAACVRRELHEEVGIHVDLIAPLSEVRHTYEHARVRLFPFVCSLRSGSTEPQPLHVDACEWTSLADLASYRFLPANDAVMQALNEFLDSWSPEV